MNEQEQGEQRKDEGQRSRSQITFPAFDETARDMTRSPLDESVL
jgi:hypothetical protein